MHFKPVIAYHSAAGDAPPQLVRDFADENELDIRQVEGCGVILEMVNRTFPAIIIFGSPGEEAIETCRTLKGEAYSAVIPVVFLEMERAEHGLTAMEVGADELLTADMTPAERAMRLQVTLNRANRDVSVHPSTRLPGTAQIERDIKERIGSGDLFAVCYADLDHFKEFNDRYGYNRGDGVIGIVARILRDVVRAYAPSGFIGHIGGDDFIFNVPLELMDVCCREILAIFDELIPYQYSEADRDRGHFVAKDRRGNVHEIPLMTLSIGVVTNRHRDFSHPARVSELATEMKSYAKTLPGSVHAVDRRRDDEPYQPPEPESEPNPQPEDS